MRKREDVGRELGTSRLKCLRRMQKGGCARTAAPKEAGYANVGVAAGTGS